MTADTDHGEFITRVGPDARPRISRLAVASVVLGLMSMCPVAAVGALLTGIWARRGIRLSDGRVRGGALAALGIGLGILCIVVTILACVAYVPLYLELRPIVGDVIAMAETGRFAESYKLFSPAYRDAHTQRDHTRRLARLIANAGEYRGLRWAYRLTTDETDAATSVVRVTFDARFANITRRIRFEFVPGP